MHALAQNAIRITHEINNQYHTEEELVALMSELTGREIDSSFGLFPPFNTDCGKNIHIGKNVFINSGCKFQDQGGIYIGDGALIGHNVTMATINHDEKPSVKAELNKLREEMKKEQKAALPRRAYLSKGNVRRAHQKAKAVKER